MHQDFAIFARYPIGSAMGTSPNSPRAREQFYIYWDQSQSFANIHLAQKAYLADKCTHSQFRPTSDKSPRNFHIDTTKQAERCKQVHRPLHIC